MMTLTVMVLCSQTAPVLQAQVSNTAPTGAETAVSPVQLQAGTWEVLNLVRAHVGDEVVIAFINNSGKAYHLSASEVLYLRGQGLSDQVLAAMLNARQNAAATTAQVALQPAATQPSAVEATSSSPQASPAAAQPAPTYQAAPVQSAPTYVPAPVYVQPSPAYFYPAPAPYYWGYPGLSLSFGFGFGGGYHGGYHGGGHH
jgi:hypothetical protein